MSVENDLVFLREQLEKPSNRDKDWRYTVLELMREIEYLREYVAALEPIATGQMQLQPPPPLIIQVTTKEELDAIQNRIRMRKSDNAR